MCPKILKNSLTGLKIGRDTRMWLENRRKVLRGGVGTDGRRKAVEEIGSEKRMTPAENPPQIIQK